MAPNSWGKWRPAAIAGLVIVVLLTTIAVGSAQEVPASAESALRAGQFQRAAALFEQQAKAGDAEAQYRLASLYRLGRGVEQDDAAAFRWMKLAAGQGHADAQLPQLRPKIAEVGNIHDG